MQMPVMRAITSFCRVLRSVNVVCHDESGLWVVLLNVGPVRTKELILPSVLIGAAKVSKRRLLLAWNKLWLKKPRLEWYLN